MDNSLVRRFVHEHVATGGAHGGRRVASTTRAKRRADPLPTEAWPTTLREHKPLSAKTVVNVANSPQRAPAASPPRGEPFASTPSRRGHSADSGRRRRNDVMPSKRTQWNSSTKPSSAVPGSNADPLYALLSRNLKREGFGADYDGAVARYLARQRASKVRSIAEGEHETSAAVWWYCTRVLPQEQREAVETEERDERLMIAQDEADRRTRIWFICRDARLALEAELWARAEAERAANEREELALLQQAAEWEETWIRRFAEIDRLEAECRDGVLELNWSEHREIVELATEENQTIAVAQLQSMRRLAESQAALARQEEIAREKLDAGRLAEVSELDELRRLALSHVQADALAQLVSEEAAARRAIHSSSIHTLDSLTRECDSLARQRRRREDLFAWEHTERQRVEADHATGWDRLQRMETESRLLAAVAAEARAVQEAETRARGALMQGEQAGLVLLARLFGADTILAREVDARKALRADEAASFEGVLRRESDEQSCAAHVVALSRIVDEESGTRQALVTEETVARAALEGLASGDRAMHVRAALRDLELVEEGKRVGIHSEALEGFWPHVHRSMFLLNLEAVQREEGVTLEAVARSQIISDKYRDRLAVLLQTEHRKREALQQSCLTELGSTRTTAWGALQKVLKDMEERRRLHYEQRLKKALASPKKFIGVTAIERLKERCLQVEAMHVGGPAHRAGLQLEDVIASVGGIPVATRDDMRRAIAATGKVNSMLDLVIHRPPTSAPASEDSRGGSSKASGSSSAAQALSRDAHTISVRVLCTDKEFADMDFFFDSSGPKLGTTTT